MPDSSLVGLALAVEGVVLVGSFALAGLRAIMVRQGLVGRSYREQALGLAAIGLYFAVFVVIGFFGPAPEASWILTLLVALFDIGLLALIIFWTNATVEVARRSDPFERDTFHYSKARYPWFAAVAATTAAGLALDPISVVLNVSVPLAPLVQLLGYTPYGATTFFGAALLIVGARRSKDRVLQRGLKWFGLALGSFAGATIVTAYLKFFYGGNYQFVGLGGLATQVEWIAFALLAAYSLYRSAGSLALTTSELDEAVVRRFC